MPRRPSGLHVYVAQIRRKIAMVDREGALADLLVAEAGVGYRVRGAEPAGAGDR